MRLESEYVKICFVIIRHGIYETRSIINWAIQTKTMSYCSLFKKGSLITCSVFKIPILGGLSVSDLSEHWSPDVFTSYFLRTSFTHKKCSNSELYFGMEVYNEIFCTSSLSNWQSNKESSNLWPTCLEFGPSFNLILNEKSKELRM